MIPWHKNWINRKREPDASILSTKNHNAMAKKLFLLLLGFLFFFTSNAFGKDHLSECCNKQLKPLQDQYLQFSFTEDRHTLEHSFEPWQQTPSKVKGEIWSSTQNFIKKDTLNRGTRSRPSAIYLTGTELLEWSRRTQEFSVATHGQFLDQHFLSAYYIPTPLLSYFNQQELGLDEESTDELAVYRTEINGCIVKLYINTADNLLHKTTMLSHHELFGDVLSTISYSDFSQVDGCSVARKVDVEKINGKLKDQILLTNLRMTTDAPFLMDTSQDMEKQVETNSPEVSTERYSKNLHFIELRHTDDKVMVVEFSDFLVVAEAPVNSENGELILAEAQKIAPNKPVKYFVFGHYHPHYLGGIRPFIHRGAEIICSEMDSEYVKYIASRPRTLHPDSLHLNPKPLRLKNIADSLTISDGQFEMKIYFIGEKSRHTKDYLVYYFPSEKLLFEDDLVWISKKGEIKKAGPRQAGLYGAVKDLNLDVETIIQSWPVADYGVKTVIPFEDLEKSVQVEK